MATKRPSVGTEILNADLAERIRTYTVSASDNGIPAWRAAQMRLSEKYHELIHLTKADSELDHERVTHTLLDMAALALIVKSLLEQE